jgi:hypothetical protein
MLSFGTKFETDSSSNRRPPSLRKAGGRHLMGKRMRVRFSDDTKDAGTSETRSSYDNMVAECCGLAYMPRLGAVSGEEILKMKQEIFDRKMRGERLTVPKLPMTSPAKAWLRVAPHNRVQVLRRLAGLVRRYTGVINTPIQELVGKTVLVRNYPDCKFNKAILNNLLTEHSVLVTYINETRSKIVKLVNIKPHISVPVLPQGGGNSIALGNEEFSRKLVADIETFINGVAATIIQSKWVSKRDKRTNEMEEFLRAILRVPATKRIQRWYKRWRSPPSGLDPCVRARLLAEAEQHNDVTYYTHS